MARPTCHIGSINDMIAAHVQTIAEVHQIFPVTITQTLKRTISLSFIHNFVVGHFSVFVDIIGVSF